MALAVTPVAVAEAQPGTGISTLSVPQSPGGSGCTDQGCGSGDASGGSGCTADGTCGHGGPQGGAGCTASGICGHGGPDGGGGCVPGVGCFNWGQ